MSPGQGETRSRWSQHLFLSLHGPGRRGSHLFAPRFAQALYQTGQEHQHLSVPLKPRTERCPRAGPGWGCFLRDELAYSPQLRQEISTRFTEEEPEAGCPPPAGSLTPVPGRTGPPPWQLSRGAAPGPDGEAGWAHFHSRLCVPSNTEKGSENLIGGQNSPL